MDYVLGEEEKSKPEMTFDDYVQRELEAEQKFQYKQMMDDKEGYMDEFRGWLEKNDHVDEEDDLDDEETLQEYVGI